jgi:hypothetical protein
VRGLEQCTFLKEAIIHTNELNDAASVRALADHCEHLTVLDVSNKNFSKRQRKELAQHFARKLPGCRFKA